MPHDNPENSGGPIVNELVEFASKADEMDNMMDNMMVERFGCEFSACTKHI